MSPSTDSTFNTQPLAVWPKRSSDTEARIYSNIRDAYAFNPQFDLEKDTAFASRSTFAATPPSSASSPTVVHGWLNDRYSSGDDMQTPFTSQATYAGIAMTQRQSSQSRPSSRSKLNPQYAHDNKQSYPPSAPIYQNGHMIGTASSSSGQAQRGNFSNAYATPTDPVAYDGSNSHFSLPASTAFAGPVLYEAPYFDNRGLPPTQEQPVSAISTTSSFAEQQHHLPTPSRTPSSDSFLPERGFHNNHQHFNNLMNKSRSKSATQADYYNQQHGRGSMMPLDQLQFEAQTPNRSPALLSVSSYGPDMPVTPRTVNSDSGDDQYSATTGEPNLYPIFDQFYEDDDSSCFDYLAARPNAKHTRTLMTDVYDDEAYPTYNNSVISNITSAPSQAAQQHQQQQQQQQPQSVPSHLQRSSVLNPYRHMPPDRATQGPIGPASSPQASASGMPTQTSPFRQTSSYATPSIDVYGPTGFLSVSSGDDNTRYGTANSPAYAAYAQQHQQRMSGAQESQATISPKDAVLEYHEPVEESTASLFRQTTNESRAFNDDLTLYGRLGSNGSQMTTPPPGVYDGRSGSVPQGQFTFSSSVPALRAAKQPSAPGTKYANFRQQRAPSSNAASEIQSDLPPDFPAHLVSMETTKSEQAGSDEASPIERPANTSANSGTYTCTYHGCTQRFASPALLQKHKKEGHRSAAATGRGSSQSPSTDATGQQDPLENTQLGPHRCDHINPATGQPCNVVFSRPYDLTRHEDTIHAQRTKVRCMHCQEEKTFSRNDALTRHMRVVHPNIPVPGKKRREAA